MEGYVVQGQLLYVNTETGIIRVLEKGKDAPTEIQTEEGVLKPEDYDSKYYERVAIVPAIIPRLGCQVECPIINGKCTALYSIEPIEGE